MWTAREREGRDHSAAVWMRGSQSELISALEVNSASVPWSGAQEGSGGGGGVGGGLISLYAPLPPAGTPKTNKGLSGQCPSTQSATEEIILDQVQD